MKAAPNPFSLEAVTTYGAALLTCELKYFRTVSDELFDYLRSYGNPDRRYGGAIGITGGHGSGKTHLLNWISQKVTDLKHADVSIVYTKADSHSLFDLYTQVITQLDRTRLLTLLDLAFKRIAIDYVGRAKITEGLQERIEHLGFEKVQAEANIDRDQVENLFRASFEGAPVQTIIAKTLLAVADPAVGIRAYEWLQGASHDLSENGLSAASLRQLHSDLPQESAADVTAVETFEALALLHDVAGGPFVVLIDQMEVLLRADAARLEGLASIIKKLVEQVGRRRALMFMAGANDGWQKLPRDVFPRLRSREPIRAGNLTFDEVRALLDSHITPEKFSDAAVTEIRDLSGGNPREIVRIAFHAYEASGGALSRLNSIGLIDAASRSGSLADRQRLCLQTVDTVLRRYGDVSPEFAIGGTKIDRVLRDGSNPVLAVLISTAVDMVSETSVAKAMGGVRRQLESEFPGCDMAVISVGYSSDEIRSAIGKTATLLSFRDESTFSGELDAAVAKSLSRRRTGPVALAPDPQVLQLLDKISNRLDGLETARRNQASMQKERFQEAAREIAQPERQERELKTRWDTIETLNRLDDRLAHDVASPEEERAVIRSLLLTNETQRLDPAVDILGGLYLEMLSLLGPAAMRRDLLSDIRNVMRYPQQKRFELGPFFIPALVIAVALVAGVGTYFTYVWSLSHLSSVTSRSLLWMTLLFLAAYAGFGAYRLVRKERTRKWERIVGHLRRRRH